MSMRFESVRCRWHRLARKFLFLKENKSVCHATGSTFF
jgi:hypothetical protein